MSPAIRKNCGKLKGVIFSDGTVTRDKCRVYRPTQTLSKYIIGK